MNKLILIIILTLGLLARTVNLSNRPIGFTPDEAAQGYSAYSILKTGRDEWGVKFPINPRSFGDFKSPIQTYLMIPLIAAFGLNEFTVRLPNALLSAFSILIAYFLVKELFWKHKTMDTQKLALLSAFLLSVNPWHISLSRGAFEANLTTFFLPLGVLLFLRGLNSSTVHRSTISNIYYPLSSLILGLNLFTYHSAKIVTPLLLVTCYLLYGRRIALKQKVFGGLMFCLFVVVAIIGFSQGGSVRSADVSVFSNSITASAEEKYRLALGGLDGFVPRILHNKLTEPAKEFTQNYLSYLSPYLLFGRGAGEGTYGMTPGFGLFYQVEMIFLVFSFIGMVIYVRKKENITPLLLIVLWIVIGFIPASLSRGVGYHANRAVIVLPAFQILVAYGLLTLLNCLTKRRKIIVLGIFAIYIFSISRFVIHYFYYAPVVNAKPMIYGWREVSNYVTNTNSTACPVIVSSELSEPQAYLAFYQKLNPLQFQKDSVNWLIYQNQGLKFVDQLGNYRLTNYQFHSFGMPEDLTGDCHLLVGLPADFNLYESVISDLQQKGLIIDKMIYYPDTSPAMRILKINGVTSNQ